MAWTQNDTQPPLDIQLDDAAFSLVGKTAQVIVRKHGATTPIVNELATVVEAGGDPETKPRVQWQWRSDDLAVAGVYEVEVETDDGAGGIRTFDAGTFEVREEYGSAP